MPRSYNGWSGIPNGSDESLTTMEPVAGVRLRVLAGDVATVLGYVTHRFHEEVEPIDRGPIDDWGWAYRSVRGSSALSNHASGTAIDLNATRHPFRTSAQESMTPAQIRACERIVADCDGVVRWLSGHDPMHFEIARQTRGGSPRDVARLAARITAGGGVEIGLAGVRKREPRSLRPSRSSTGLSTGLVRVVQAIVGTEVDGRHGPMTEAATKALQARMGVDEDGAFGPVTARAYLLSLPDQREGSTGAGVRLIQWIGAESADGIWGSQTKVAVQSLQAWAKLAVDGVAGPKTKRAIVR